MRSKVLIISLVCTAVYAHAQDQYSITMKNNSFEIKKGTESKLIPLKKKKDQYKKFYCFESKCHLSWNQKGITTSKEGKQFSTFLEGVPVSRNYFTVEQILFHKQKIKSGEWDQKAKKLIATAKIDQKVYMLLQWMSKGNQVWLEGLVEIDFKKPFPKPQFIGAMPKMNISSKKIPTPMYAHNNQLIFIRESGDNWGAYAYAGKEKWNPRYKKLGSKLEQCVLGTDKSVVVVCEKSKHGSYLVSKVDPSSGRKQNISEAYYPTKIYTNDPLVLKIKNGDEVRYRSIETGAELRAKGGGKLKPFENGLVLEYGPKNDPRHAKLYDAESWNLKSEWKYEPPVDQIKKQLKELKEIPEQKLDVELEPKAQEAPKKKPEPVKSNLDEKIEIDIDDPIEMDEDVDESEELEDANDSDSEQGTHEL